MSNVTYMAWPEHSRLSYQVSRILGLCDFGAADFTEVYQAVLRIEPDDDYSWNREWLRVAHLVGKTAQEAEAHNNLAAARYAHQRASNYYRLAQDTLPPDDPNKLSQLHKARDHFLKALPYQETRVDRVEIPYEETTLTGFFVHARWANGPAPTVIWLSGADSLSEENCFNTGYNTFFYDHPGPGLALYEQGFGTRYDSEHFVAPAVDYLLSRPEVDGGRIILGGPSFAAYHVPRAAAFENRLAAAVSVGAMHEWSGGELEGGTHLARMLRLFGAGDAEEYRTIRSRFNLRGVLEKVTCPFLVVVGVDDFAPFPASTAIRYLEELGSEVKRARVIEHDNELGGVLHCQKDNLHVMVSEVFNWLNDILGFQPPRP